MSVPEPPSAFIRFCKARRPSLKQERPGISFGELTEQLGTEWNALGGLHRAPYEAAKAAEDVASGYSGPAHDLLCCSCRAKSNGSDWKCLSVPEALAMANEMYGNQAWVDGWNSADPLVQTTVEEAGQMAVDTFMASRFNHCWVCPACAFNE